MLSLACILQLKALSWPTEKTCRVLDFYSDYIFMLAIYHAVWILQKQIYLVF